MTVESVSACAETPVLLFRNGIARKNAKRRTIVIFFMAQTSGLINNRMSGWTAHDMITNKTPKSENVINSSLIIP